MTATPPSTRSTATQRREHLLEAAMAEFATRGYAGGSTERIAAAAGISQPYVFRLFGSKQRLFLASLERCFDETFELFERAVGDLRGEPALAAVGQAYGDLIATHPLRLQLQLVGYASCDDPDVRELMRTGYGRLVRFVERVSGAGEDRVTTFFAKGMLMNVLTSMQLPGAGLGWGDRLIAGCLHRQP